MLPLKKSTLRRLALHRQRLAGQEPEPTLDGLMEVMRDLRCLQIDPIRAVERTQYLVLFSRLGVYDPGLLHQAAYDHKLLFEYWAHAASYVLTEDYPIHNLMMRTVSYGKSKNAQRFKEWLEANRDYERYILDKVRTEGMKQVSEIEDLSELSWDSGGWWSGRSTPLMVQSLWDRGLLTVARREGNRKFWELSERFFPDWMPRDTLDPSAVTREAAQLSLRALGAGTPRHIRSHFIRDRYPELETILEALVTAGVFVPIEIRDDDGTWSSAGRWYLHREDAALAEAIERGNWQPRTALLSPFDNLICDRDRTELMWDFRFRIEIYVPANKRTFGYYVMPILHEDRIIGRIDPKMDRKSRTLRIKAVYREADSPDDTVTLRAIRAEIEALARFLGAKSITFEGDIPTGWEVLRT